MASNFIPMLSSSPPPIDDCPDNEDDDEEFGTFSSANIGFDSSFDSPTSVDKYKSFQPGDNGIKDTPLNISPQNFKLKFQSNHNSVSKPIQTANEDQVIVEKLSRSPSVEEICTANKDSNVTSHNGFSESMDNTPEGYYISSNNRSKLDESKKNQLNLEHLTLNHSNEDVPVVNSKLGNNESKHIPDSDSSNDCQSNNMSDLELPESVASINSLEAKVEPSNHDRSSLDNGVDCTSSEFNLDFPVSFPENDSFNEFENFQASGVVNSTVLDGNTLLNTDVSNIENDKDTFEPDFDNCQTEEIGISNFTDLQLEREESSDFDDFQSGKQEISNFTNPETEKGDFSNFTDFQTGKEAFSNFTDFQTENEEFSDFTDFQTGKEESSNFADFQTDDKEQPHSDLDDFDDFQTFDVGEVEFKSFNDTNVTSDPKDKESEDFADFQTCSDAPLEQGFADFQGRSFSKEVDSISPGFADFETASFSFAGEKFPNSSSSSHTQVKTDKLSTVIDTIFPLQEVPGDIDISCDPAPEVLEQSNKSLRLWEKLHEEEQEQTPNMRLQWGVSHTFQRLLRSVNVDYHSILRTSSVPIFASGLSLLEPAKGPAGSANPDSEDKVQSPRDPIPPVEFDWNTSGLTNPLDSVQAISTLMDLSFLSPSSESKTSSLVEADSFESELLKPSPAPASTKSNKNYILEELLSKNVCSLPNSNITHRPPDLSKEANSVLDQLPDLSFVRAKVLMFPIISNKT